MGDVSSFYTQQAASGSSNGPLNATGKSAAVLAGSGTGQFLDLLLATLNVGQPATTDATTDTTATTTSAPAVDALSALQTPVATTDEKSDTPDTNIDMVNLMVPVVPVVTTPVQTGASATVTAETPAISGPAPAPTDGADNNTAGDDQKALDAQLKSQLAALGIQTDDQNNLILPADADNAPVPAPVAGSNDNTQVPVKTVATTVPTGPLPEDTVPNAQLAAQLNAMTVGSGKTDEGKSGTDESAKPADLLTTLMNGTDSTDTKNAYKPVISATTTAAGYQGETAKATTPAIMISTDADAVTPDDTLVSIDLSALSPDRWAGVVQTAAQNAANGTSGAASVTGAQTQAMVNAVALHLQQLAQNRDTRSLTLQLNPPELGKMQVKMTYGKDKTVKADILIEKSDTLNMLQKDADALQQALNNAGLKADASSLSFSLADQNGFANNMGNDGQSGSGNRGSGDDTIDMTAIEIKSSEEWSVDPKTGIVRYNIVV